MSGRVAEERTRAPRSPDHERVGARPTGRLPDRAGDVLGSAFAAWDLGSVRVHADVDSSRAMLAQGAEAVTRGESVWLARPPTARTLAHELAHVVQQRPGCLPADVGRSETALEAHAEAVADRAVAGGPVEELFAGSSRPAGPPAEVRARPRRIPPNVAALLTSSTGGRGVNFDANAEGVYVLIQRAMGDLTHAERVQVYRRARGARTQAAFDALPRRQRRIAMVDAILALFPAHELGDPALIDAPPPAGSTEETNLASLAAIVNPVFVAIASGGRDTEITRVFGAAQLATAKARYAAAQAMMNSLIASGHVLTDLSLFTEEISEGGTTDPGVSIALSAGILRAPTAESAITLLHEAMHAGTASIGDLGYLDTTGFRTMPAADKLNNAAHYEVVPRQILGVAPTFAGVVFIPAGTTVAGVTAPPRTAREDGAKAASDALEDTWGLALNLHRVFVRVLLTPATWPLPQADLGARRPDQALPFWSKVERLTVHRKPVLNPASPDPASRPVSQIDIALSEGFTRRVGQANDLISGLDTDAQIDAFENARSTAAQRAAAFPAGHTAATERAFLLRLALRDPGIGPITGSLARDLRVVDLMASVGDLWADILMPRNPADFSD